MSGAKFFTGTRVAETVSLITSTWIVALGIAAMFLTAESLGVSSSDSTASAKEKVAVIFDTDICDDIDDTWALVLLLRSPEFDVKLVTTEVGNTEAKARVVARLLEIASRTDIPVGIGLQQHKNEHRQTPWAKDYDLSSYPGTIHRDGVQAIVDTIMSSSKPMKVVAVGPLPNIAAALQHEPRIAQKAEFVGMHGSVRRGYGGSTTLSAEYNVRAFAKEAQKVFTAGWNVTITPLDTCGIVQLKDQKYQRVFKSRNRLTRALIENYRVWYRQGILNERKDMSEAELNKKVAEKVDHSSTTLFDTVAIYLAMSTELVKMEKLPIVATDDGYTRIDDKGKVINCATEWKDLGAFEDFLVDRLTQRRR
jgi:inosine-uridine nucleoside N-ribohydrolase